MLLLQLAKGSQYQGEGSGASCPTTYTAGITEAMHNDGHSRPMPENVSGMLSVPAFSSPRPHGTQLTMGRDQAHMSAMLARLAWLGN
jgi:hypothetical protein